MALSEEENKRNKNFEVWKGNRQCFGLLYGISWQENPFKYFLTLFTSFLKILTTLYNKIFARWSRYISHPNNSKLHFIY